MAAGKLPYPGYVYKPWPKSIIDEHGNHVLVHDRDHYEILTGKRINEDGTPYIDVDEAVDLNPAPQEESAGSNIPILEKSKAPATPRKKADKAGEPEVTADQTKGE